MADQSAAPSAAPDRPGAGNAISLNENDLADAMWQVRWQSLRTFYSAPCLAQSVLLGIGGGAVIGALRAVGRVRRTPPSARVTDERAADERARGPQRSVRAHAARAMRGRWGAWWVGCSMAPAGTSAGAHSGLRGARSSSCSNVSIRVIQRRCRSTGRGVRRRSSERWGLWAHQLPRSLSSIALTIMYTSPLSILFHLMFAASWV